MFPTCPTTILVRDMLPAMQGLPLDVGVRSSWDTSDLY